MNFRSNINGYPFNLAKHRPSISIIQPGTHYLSKLHSAILLLILSNTVWTLHFFTQHIHTYQHCLPSKFWYFQFKCNADVVDVCTFLLSIPVLFNQLIKPTKLHKVPTKVQKQYHWLLCQCWPCLYWGIIQHVHKTCQTLCWQKMSWVKEL